jgi:hypothetical protein
MAPAEPTIHTASRSFVGTVLLTLAGPIIWALHFLVIYGAHTLMCVQGASERDARVVIGVATLIALAALALAAWRIGSVEASGRQRGQTRGFLRNIMFLLSVLSAFAVAWAGSTILFLSACQAMR